MLNLQTYLIMYINGNEVMHIITKRRECVMTIQSIIREVWATTLKDVQNFEEIDNASNT